MMMLFVKLVILVTIFCLKTCSGSGCKFCGLERYSLSEPLINALSPRGLEVSIPDDSGITLFAFHGNINIPLNGIEAGQLSRDILRKENGRWVFRDTSVKLNIGDKIYYWIFVIKDNSGYRYDNGFFEVKEITQKPKNGNGKGHATRERLENNEKFYQDIISNLTSTLHRLQTSHDVLSEENSILRDLIEKHPETARRLHLEGHIPTNEDSLAFVQIFIKHKLHLPFSVRNAKRDNGSIEFETLTLNDKISIIRTAMEKLNSSSYTITY